MKLKEGETWKRKRNLRKKREQKEEEKNGKRKKKAGRSEIEIP